MLPRPSPRRAGIVNASGVDKIFVLELDLAFLNRYVTAGAKKRERR
jgi:hypothetical protein